MTFEDACKVRTPTGKTIGEASPDDWAAMSQFWRDEHARFERMTVEEFVASEDRELAAAFFEREIEWEQAMIAVWTRIGEVSEKAEARDLAKKHIASSEAALEELPGLVQLARTNGQGGQQNG